LIVSLPDGVHINLRMVESISEVKLSKVQYSIRITMYSGHHHFWHFHKIGEEKKYRATFEGLLASWNKLLTLPTASD
jgi:hypothetical protein